MTEQLSQFSGQAEDTDTTFSSQFSGQAEDTDTTFSLQGLLSQKI